MANPLLARVPLFADLGEAELEKVAACVRPSIQPEGAALFRCGDPSDSFYVIEHGRVQIQIPATKVQEARTVELGPGDFFGEMGILRDRTRMADATTLEQCRLLRIDRAAFRGVVASDGVLQEKITRTFKQRMLEYQASASAAEKSIEEPRVLTMLSAGGHEGASFLCANLGSRVSELTGTRALAVDLNFGNPSLQRYLGALSDTGTFSRIFTEDEITSDLIKKCAARLDHGVDLLAGSGTGSIMLSPVHMRNLMPRLPEAYEWVVVDAGEGRSHLDEEVIRFSDIVHVALESEGGSVSRATDLVAALKTLGLEGRIRLVVNKAPATLPIPVEEIEKAVGAEVIGVIHHSDLQEKQGRKPSAPVVHTHPRSQVAEEVHVLAQALVSQPKGSLDSIGGFLRSLFFGG